MPQPHEDAMDPMMTSRIQAVLASYGADPARWPASERAELLPHLAAAGEALDEARHIDRLLDLAAAPVLALGLERRLMGQIAKPAAQRRPPLGWSAALPLAASLALGVYLGAVGSLDSLLPSAVVDDIADLDEDDDSDLSGATEATDYSEGELS
ncbi:MAG: hypothetical protein H7X89_10350 [Rhizobiales bacterium]|nr:hypothetical protein [Hyphomicrobiales bacterium]